MIDTERCLTGRLGQAYPAAAHDVELRVAGVASNELSEVLRVESDRILREDADCRKVVFAATPSDHEGIQAAERAGFRYVLEVDVPTHRDGVRTLSLLVREPEFVTHVDMDLDKFYKLFWNFL